MNEDLRFYMTGLFVHIKHNLDRLEREVADSIHSVPAYYRYYASCRNLV